MILKDNFKKITLFGNPFPVQTQVGLIWMIRGRSALSDFFNPSFAKPAIKRKDISLFIAHNNYS